MGPAGPSFQPRWFVATPKQRREVYRHDELGASDCRSNLGLGFGHTKVGQASHHKPAKGDASHSFEMRAGFLLGRARSRSTV